MTVPPMIRVENLGKKYPLVHRGPRDRGLRHLISDSLRAPVRCLRRLGSSSSAAFRSRATTEDFWALNEVSFTVARGEVLGIIGRNGAGKSTLLKILSRITSPTAGRVRLRGRVASLLEVGTGFHPELTGRENIFLNGAILGMGRAEIRRKFDAIVAFAEVERFIDTPVKRYSSGMYMRLAFAVAAQLTSEILIVDEVLAVGDLAFQKKCLGKMREVAGQEERTVLFVSHNLAAVRKLCTRAILLNQGRIVIEGPPDAVINRYVRVNESHLAASIALPAMGAEVQPPQLHLLNESGQSQAQFRLGETWRVQFDFQMAAARPHVIAAVGLRTVEGTPLITYWSAPKDLAAGAYRVEFRCQLPFCAGEYNFAVGVSSNERAIYYTEGAGALSITEVAQGAQPFRAAGAGLIASTARPEIVRLEDEPEATLDPPLCANG